MRSLIDKVHTNVAVYRGRSAVSQTAFERGDERGTAAPILVSCEACWVGMGPTRDVAGVGSAIGFLWRRGIAGRISVAERPDSIYGFDRWPRGGVDLHMLGDG